MSTPNSSGILCKTLDFSTFSWYHVGTYELVNVLELRRVIAMDISSINSALGSIEANSATSTMGKVGMAMLDKSLEQSDQMNKSMIQMMERSVNPNIGGNFDMSI